jgi:hypothetical protein
MMREATVREWRQNLRDSLDGWSEPGGHLVPSEPDPEGRAQVRAELKIAIDVLTKVLGEDQ